METSNRLSRPDRLEIFGKDWDDPDDHMETRLKNMRKTTLEPHFLNVRHFSSHKLHRRFFYAVCGSKNA